MLYVFDVDETLTPSGLPMEEPMLSFFREHMNNKPIFIVSGGRKVRLQTQFPQDLWEKIDGVFPTLGAEFWRNGEMVSRNEFIWPEGLQEELDTIVAESTFPQQHRTSTLVEDRGSMLCLTLCGLGANKENRAKYIAHDQHQGERKKIQARLLKKFGDKIEVAIGGQTSIDMSMKGSDKAQILPLLRQYFSTQPIIFFGDRIEEGGNDLPLATALQQESEKNIIIPVKNPEDTFRKLQEIIKKEA